MWLVLGVLTIWFRRIALAGDVETPEDWAFVILGCILPYLVGIYFVFSEKLLSR